MAADLLRLLADAEHRLEAPVYRQYDHTVQTNTRRRRPARPTRPSCGSRARQRRIALTTDCNGRYCHLDPYRGGAMRSPRRRATSSATARGRSR